MRVSSIKVQEKSDPACAGSLQEFCQNFRGDRSGAVAIIFALTIVTLVTLVGGTVDYARWLNAKGETVAAMDAAVLAGGRALQLGKSNAEAEQIAADYYEKNKAKNISVNSVTFSVENNGRDVVAVSTSKVQTLMLGVAGIHELPINETARAVVGDGGSDVEVSLMLDTTGSMAGQKMVDLKAAATDLVNIVIWQDQSRYTSRVALAPFSRYVNVSSSFFQGITNQSPSGSGDQTTCVKERDGSNRYTDAKPDSGNGYFQYFSGWGTCAPTSVIVPLTSNKSDLTAAIDNMPASGTTAGHLGTAWSWYLLSPNWNSVWPTESKPFPYSHLFEHNSNNQPKLRKIAVLMTDGEYNTQHSGSASATQAREICTNMKEAGLVVYTVGFAIQVGGESDTTMAQCATSPAHYYNAADGDELRAAFRDIALQISTLRISE